MNWKAHVVIGMIISAIFFYFLFGVKDEILLAQLIGISGLAALVPDLDHEMSKGKKILDIIIIAFAALVALPSQSILLFLGIVGAYFLLYKLLKPKHRGITHTVIACILFSVLIYFLAGINAGVASFLGYFSHLLLDRF